jgi:hypothetical protein
MRPPDQVKPSCLQLAPALPANMSAFGPLASSGVMQVRLVALGCFIAAATDAGRPGAVTLTVSIVISHSPGWSFTWPPEPAALPVPSALSSGPPQAARASRPAAVMQDPMRMSFLPLSHPTLTRRARLGETVKRHPAHSSGDADRRWRRAGRITIWASCR